MIDTSPEALAKEREAILRLGDDVEASAEFLLALIDALEGARVEFEADAAHWDECLRKSHEQLETAKAALRLVGDLDPMDLEMGRFDEAWTAANTALAEPEGKAAP